MLKTPKKEFYTRYDVLSILNNIYNVLDVGMVKEGMELMKKTIEGLED